MNDWIHPTGGRPESVLMIMLGATKAAYADLMASVHDSPFKDPEIWTCNAGFRIWQHDLLFVMDDLVEEAHKWPEYGNALAQHSEPMITSTCYPDWPDAIAYPYQQVCGALNLNGRSRYFRNTLPFMIAYALALKVRQITIFGADYYHADQGRREADLANAEWWLGYASALGVSIDIPAGSTLMQCHLPFTTYGYRLDPALTMDRRRADDLGHIARRVANTEGKGSAIRRAIDDRQVTVDSGDTRALRKSDAGVATGDGAPDAGAGINPNRFL